LSERPAGAPSVPPAAWLAAFPHFVIAAVIFSFWCPPTSFPREAIGTLIVIVIVDVCLSMLCLPMASFVFASGPKLTRALCSGFDRLLVDPVAATALGCFYYTAMGISELFENRWAPPDPPRREPD